MDDEKRQADRAIAILLAVLAILAILPVAYFALQQARDG
jgi:hypothetical protein